MHCRSKFPLSRPRSRTKECFAAKKIIDLTEEEEEELENEEPEEVDNEAPEEEMEQKEEEQEEEEQEIENLGKPLLPSGARMEVASPIQQLSKRQAPATTGLKKKYAAKVHICISHYEV